MNKEIKQGIWIKYDCEPGNWFKQEASYHRLYNDLKDTNVDWHIKHSIEECMDELCGEFIPNEGTIAGDIYVYYEKENDVKVPIFYLHVSEFDDFETKEKRNHIYFSGNSIGCDDIDDEYIPELIRKLKEIDESKNKKYIDELEERYENYKKLLSLQGKNNYTEEDLVFLYYMAYNQHHPLAISLIENRDINVDFKNLNDENKVKLFLSIKKSDIINKLTISSKNILKEIAKNKCLSQLSCTTDEIINDKEYIIELLEQFFEADKYCDNELMLEKYLPSIYKIDIDILELIFSKYNPYMSFMYASWIAEAETKTMLSDDPKFIYRLMDSLLRVLIRDNQDYYRNSLLWIIDNDLLSDLENHILIGPEPTLEKENLKNRIIKDLIEDKEKVLSKKKK